MRAHGTLHPCGPCAPLSPRLRVGVQEGAGLTGSTEPLPPQPCCLLQVPKPSPQLRSPLTSPTGAGGLCWGHFKPAFSLRDSLGGGAHTGSQ